MMRGSIGQSAVLCPRPSLACHIPNSSDSTDKPQSVKVKAGGILVFLDSASLFALCQKQGTHLEGSSPTPATNFTLDQIRTLLDLCLCSNHFKCSNGFYGQKHGVVASTQDKGIALIYTLIPSHWFHHVVTSESTKWRFLPNT